MWFSVSACILQAGSLDISHLLTQVTQPPSQLKEQLYLYENFTDQSSGYSAVKNVKKLVKHLERIQGQYNIAEDEVSYQKIEDVSMKVLYEYGMCGGEV